MCNGRNLSAMWVNKVIREPVVQFSALSTDASTSSSISWLSDSGICKQTKCPASNVSAAALTCMTFSVCMHACMYIWSYRARLLFIHELNLVHYVVIISCYSTVYPFLISTSLQNCDFKHFFNFCSVTRNLVVHNIAVSLRKLNL